MFVVYDDDCGDGTLSTVQKLYIFIGVKWN